VAGKQRSYTLRPSRILALLLGFLSCLVLIVLWQMMLPLWLMIGLMLVVVVWAGYHLTLDAKLRLPHACVAFRLEEGGEIMLILRNGLHVPCTLRTDSLVTPYLVILNASMIDQHGERNVVIAPDSMNTENFRRLRVALKWGEDTPQGAR
jgi:toxin CptA